MAPSKSKSSRKPASKQTPKPDKKSNGPASGSRRKPQDQQQQQKPSSSNDEAENKIDISSTIPLTLQQLLLNVFKAALLQSHTPSQAQGDPQASTAEESQLDIKTLIQTLKSHLYNRDFDSAFADASGELLRAYALRWSAARALGYAGLFKSILGGLTQEQQISGASAEGQPGKNHIVCIGGGAGAEIVALAAAWRDLTDTRNDEMSDALAAVSLDAANEEEAEGGSHTENSPSSLSVTAVDIGDWSTVVDRLSSTVQSPNVPSSKSHPAPLLPAHSNFTVDFNRLDVLSLSDSELDTLYHTSKPSSTPPTTLVTLMFTLNELFSTSMAKATAFLLKTTDHLQAGTILLVVDSPGSYSTLKLGKSDSSGAPQERQYPMKFLLDHTLLSVAKGKWEKIFSQDSRWWRRDAARLWYDAGEGAGLEDMRFQIHVYRRL
jgi:25S rRNA (uracil2843-N3)-methyltransferase